LGPAPKYNNQITKIKKIPQKLDNVSGIAYTGYIHKREEANVAVYHIAVTEYKEAFIEADSSDIAMQIWYQNTENLTTQDTNIEVHLEAYDVEEWISILGKEPDLTMEDYDPNGGKIRV